MANINPTCVCYFPCLRVPLYICAFRIEDAVNVDAGILQTTMHIQQTACLPGIPDILAADMRFADSEGR